MTTLAITRGPSLTLLDAGRTGNASQLRRLLKDPNIDLKQEDDEGRAVLEGFMYDFLLVNDRGRNALNVPSDNGDTLFHLACKDGRLVMVYILLRLRGD